MHLDGDNMRTDRIKNGVIHFNEEHGPCNGVDPVAVGLATLLSGTSSDSETDVLGEPELATPKRSRYADEEAVKQLVRFIHDLCDREPDHHRRPLSMPIPWGQRPLPH